MTEGIRRNTWRLTQVSLNSERSSRFLTTFNSNKLCFNGEVILDSLVEKLSVDC